MNEKDCLMLQYIYEEQNITKAAERLYITQPAITYRLQQIEKDFGVPIISKNGKGIKLTAEGEYLVSFAKKMLIELRKTKDYLANMRNEAQGTLRIGVSRYIARYKLPPILKNFITLYPKIEINVFTGLSYEVFELLQNEEIHIGIIRGDYKWFEHKYLISEETICIISKDKINIDDLPNLPKIQYVSQKNLRKVKSYTFSKLSEWIDRWWHERFNEPPLITMQVDSYDTCKEMVKNGLGYAIIPRIFLSPDDQLHAMDLILKNGQGITLNTWMLYRESSLQLNIVDKFANYIQLLNLDEEF